MVPNRGDHNPVHPIHNPYLVQPPLYDPPAPRLPGRYAPPPPNLQGYPGQFNLLPPLPQYQYGEPLYPYMAYGPPHQPMFNGYRFPPNHTPVAPPTVVGPIPLAGQPIDPHPTPAVAKAAHAQTPAKACPNPEPQPGGKSYLCPSGIFRDITLDKLPQCTVSRSM